MPRIDTTKDDLLRSLETELAELLSEDDLLNIAEAIEPGSSAAVLIWENTWAVPFATAMRRAGGHLVAGGRIPIQQLALALEEEIAEIETGA